MNKEIEVWRDIEGYEGLYQVSNWGQVKSLNYRRTGKEKILKQGKYSNGYLQLALNQNGKHKRYLIHRLVALAFIPNPENFPCVNHLDENKENNHVDNLEWCTIQYNTNYGESPKKISQSKINHPKRSKIILQYTLDGEFVAEYPSIREIERRFNYLHSSIYKCCKNYYRFCSAYNFLWFYKDDFSNEKLLDKIEQYKSKGLKK